jgi:hypothetical protein
MHQTGKIVCLIFFILLFFGNGQSHQDNENLNLSKPGVIPGEIDTFEGAPVVSAVGHNSTITGSACITSAAPQANAFCTAASYSTYGIGYAISRDFRRAAVGGQE